MEVGKINSSNFLKVSASPKKQNFPSFKGGVMSEVEYMRELCRNPKMAKFVLKNSWLEKLQGELGGIIVTAVGTGLVAPFPIAYNPFVKAKPDATIFRMASTDFRCNSGIFPSRSTAIY